MLPQPLNCEIIQYSLKEAKLDKAFKKRQAEFWAGRSLMMLALSLSYPPGQKKNGAPFLPEGKTGSLAHSSNRLVFLVSDENLLLGVDIESLLPPVSVYAVINRIATIKEQSWLRTLDFPEQQIAATILFSCKETLFKALQFDKKTFKATCLEAPDPPIDGLCIMQLVNIVNPFLKLPQKFSIHYNILDGFVLTWLQI